MQLFKLATIDASMPYVGRALGLGVCNSINFFLINTASGIIRQRRAGIPDATAWEPNPVNHIDNYDEASKDNTERNETNANREEQGFTVPENPTIVAGYLKVIFAELQAELHRMARTYPFQSMPGRSFPDKFDIPFTIPLELERQMIQKLPDEKRLAREAEILEMPIETIRNIAIQKDMSRINWIRENAGEITELISNWHLEGDDAMLDHHACVERLHPMQQLRLLAGADQGLWFGITNTIRNNQRLDILEVKKQKDFLQGKRDEVLNEVERLMRIDSFQRQVMEAELRGQTYPKFNPRQTKRETKVA